MDQDVSNVHRRSCLKDGSYFVVCSENVAHGLLLNWCVLTVNNDNGNEAEVLQLRCSSKSIFINIEIVVFILFGNKESTRTVY